MSKNVTVALDACAALGECPRWHSEKARLYWVDIGRRELHRFDPASARMFFHADTPSHALHAYACDPVPGHCRTSG